MSLIKKINDPNGKQYDDISIGTLVLDTEPIPGSFNSVTSDGVAKAIDAILPAGTSQSNPLMNAADTERMIAEILPINANTLRFNFSKKDYNPTIAGVGSIGTWTKISKYANIWDWTVSSNTFANAFENAFIDDDNLVSVIAAGDTSSIVRSSYMFSGCTSLTSVVLFDTSNDTSMGYMFQNCESLKTIPLFNTSNCPNLRYMFSGCTSLTSVPLFNTSNATAMFNMFSGCASLTNVPLFDTSNATVISDMFNGCRKVESGALALYQQVSTQTTLPQSYSDMFLNCGIDTTTGAAELSQIPASWGGLAEG